MRAAGWMEGDKRLCVPDVLTHINDREIEYFPPQEAFQRLDCRYPGLVAGVGFGKTRAGWQWMLGRIIQAWNATQKRGLLYLYGCLTYPLLRDAILPEAINFLSNGCGMVEGVHYRVNLNTMSIVFPPFGNARVLLRPLSGEHNLRRVIGMTLAAAVLDEPGRMEEKAHRAVDERTREPALKAVGREDLLAVAAVGTPEGINWYAENYEKDPRPGWLFVRGETRQNPYLPESYFASLYERYPKHLIESYLKGLFVPLLEGQAYKFDRNKHLTAEAVYNPLLPIALSWDFNVQPLCLNMGHRVGTKFYTFDEITLDDGRTEDACREFLGRYGQHASGVKVYGDQTGTSRSTQSRWTNYEIIREHLGGLPRYEERIPTANPSQINRINVANTVLENGYGVVNYGINPKCRQVIKSWETTLHKRDGGLVKGRDPDGQETFEHHTDAIGYWLWQEAPFERLGRMGNPRREARLRRGARA